MRSPIRSPLVLIAELTHRCPLRCAYCSNPRALVPGEAELGTSTWQRVMAEAAALGVVQLQLTGGEPLLRTDLPAIIATASRQGLHSTLVTSGLGASGEAACTRALANAVEAGARAVQVSFQDTHAAPAAEITGRDAIERKIRFARRARELGVSLIVNFVLHRNNLARLEHFIDLSLELGADRLELAHVQYHGWAELNRFALLPTRAQITAANRTVAAAKRLHAERLDILYLMPDMYSDCPKGCMDGWGSRAVIVDPQGLVLPCQGATVLELPLESVLERDLAAIWAESPLFQAFRGDASGCDRRHGDFGGCRCQALAMTGRRTATDPAGVLTPDREQVAALRRVEGASSRPYVLRSAGATAASNGEGSR